VKTKLFFQIVSVCVIIIFYEYDKILHRLLHVLLVPIQLLQFLVTLWRDTLHSHELPASNDIRPHRFYFFYSSRIKVKQVQNPITFCLKNYKFITTILITIVQQDCSTWCRDTSTWALSMAPVFILKTNCQNLPSNVTIDHF